MDPGIDDLSFNFKQMFDSFYSSKEIDGSRYRWMPSLYWETRDLLFFFVVRDRWILESMNVLDKFVLLQGCQIFWIASRKKSRRFCKTSEKKMCWVIEFQTPLRCRYHPNSGQPKSRRNILWCPVFKWCRQTIWKPDKKKFGFWTIWSIFLSSVADLL